MVCWACDLLLTSLFAFSRKVLRQSQSMPQQTRHPRSSCVLCALRPQTNDFDSITAMLCFLVRLAVFPLRASDLDVGDETHASGPYPILCCTVLKAAHEGLGIKWWYRLRRALTLTQYAFAARALRRSQIDVECKGIDQRAWTAFGRCTRHNLSLFLNRLFSPIIFLRFALRSHTKENSIASRRI